MKAKCFRHGTCYRERYDELVAAFAAWFAAGMEMHSTVETTPVSYWVPGQREIYGSPVDAVLAWWKEARRGA